MKAHCHAQEVVWIALGSNLGDRLQNLLDAVRNLREHVGLRDMTMSRIWRTPPVGMDAETPAFANAVVRAVSDVSPQELLARLQQLEVDSGRPCDHGRNESRVIDLDIILFGDRVIDEPGLIVPHPRASQRRFVLQPMADIDEAVVFPEGQTVAALLATAPVMQLRPWPAD